MEASRSSLPVSNVLIGLPLLERVYRHQLVAGQLRLTYETQFFICCQAFYPQT